MRKVNRNLSEIYESAEKFKEIKITNSEELEI